MTSQQWTVVASKGDMDTVLKIHYFFKVHVWVLIVLFLKRIQLWKSFAKSGNKEQRNPVL